jgi:hypothetical protein
LGLGAAALARRGNQRERAYCLTEKGSDDYIRVNSSSSRFPARIASGRTSLRELFPCTRSSSGAGAHAADVWDIAQKAPPQPLQQFVARQPGIFVNQVAVRA